MAKQPVISEWSLEEKLLRLEEISSALDKGELAIEVQLALYEEGVTLARQCREYIDKAKLKITELGSMLQNQADGSSEDE